MKCLVLLLFSFTWVVFSQEIDHTKLSHLPRRALKVVLPFAENFVASNPTVANGIPIGYSTMVTNEHVSAPIDIVWSTYTETSPREVWSGPLVNFAMAYDREEETIFYDSDEVPHFKVGLKSLNYLKV